MTQPNIPPSSSSQRPSSTSSTRSSESPAPSKVVTFAGKVVDKISSTKEKISSAKERLKSTLSIGTPKSMVLPSSTPVQTRAVSTSSRTTEDLQQKLSNLEKTESKIKQEIGRVKSEITTTPESNVLQLDQIVQLRGQLDNPKNSNEQKQQFLNTIETNLSRLHKQANLHQQSVYLNDSLSDCQNEIIACQKELQTASKTTAQHNKLTHLKADKQNIEKQLHTLEAQQKLTPEEIVAQLEQVSKLQARLKQDIPDAQKKSIIDTLETVVPKLHQEANILSQINYLKESLTQVNQEIIQARQS